MYLMYLHVGFGVVFPVSPLDRMLVSMFEAESGFCQHFFGGCQLVSEQ